jgi:hypothetical protein
MSVLQKTLAARIDDRPRVVLTPEARQWLADTPRKVRPNMLMLKFPRIVNEITKRWSRPVQCEKYLDELLFDTRDGTRQGFPAEIAIELAALKARLHALIHERRLAANPDYISVWE